ncbi:MAG TPA: response regulator transcription factor [Thermodesulfobacteriota bacterium]
MTVRVVIADDSPDARAAIRSVLGRDPMFEVVGEAADGHEALRLVAERSPDMVLMDLAMPRCDGLLATRLVKRRAPEVTVVVLTVSDDPRDLFEAIRNGAQGYLLKRLHPADWLDYLRRLATGDAAIPREVAARILAEFDTGARPAAPAPTEVGLTEREAEVLRLVARAMTNKEIGETLGISEQTVKNHLKHIVQKLHLKNRVDLAMYAARLGLDRDHCV